MISALLQERCWNHAQREAAARCPECQRFYCRECVTEHGDRMLCAGCLLKLQQPTAPAPAPSSGAGILRALLLAAGVFTAFVFFYSIGRLLLAIPGQYHEGAIWRTRWEAWTQ